MACTITNLAPLGRPCTPQMGGVKYVYLLSAPGNPGGVIHLNGTSEDAIDVSRLCGLGNDGEWGVFAYLSGSLVQSAEDLLASLIDQGWVPSELAFKFFRFDVTRQGAVATSEATVNRENGTTFYRNAVTIPTVGLPREAVERVIQIGRGGCVVVAETYSGQFVAFGFEERATLDAATLTTGANWGDMPGATITLAAEESVPIAADMCLAEADGTRIETKTPALVKVFKDFLSIHA